LPPFGKRCVIWIALEEFTVKKFFWNQNANFLGYKIEKRPKKPFFFSFFFFEKKTIYAYETYIYCTLHIISRKMYKRNSYIVKMHYEMIKIPYKMQKMLKYCP
jgi:hypothetical protein